MGATRFKVSRELIASSPAGVLSLAARVKRVERFRAARWPFEPFFSAGCPSIFSAEGAAGPCGRRLAGLSWRYMVRLPGASAAAAFILLEAVGGARAAAQTATADPAR